MKLLTRCTHPASHARRQARTGILRAALTLLTCLAGTSAFVQASIVPDAKPKDWPANPQKHQVAIRREAANENDRRFIAIAEAAQPPAESVRKAAGDTKFPETGKLWWYKKELDLRIPYAVTGDAVGYFTDLVKKYGQTSHTRYVEPSSRVEYTAKVAFHAEFSRDGATFKNVHVVSLKLVFSQNFCATGTEGLAFQKERVVVIDAAGAVLQVFGDGPTETPVLAI